MTSKSRTTTRRRMITYNLGTDVTAFTTERDEGREPQILCPALCLPDHRFLRPHQVHGTKVMRITEDDIKAFPMTGANGWECDAVIYDVREACIGISTADCIPVLCYDPEHRCAAAIHAGWRGTVARIVAEAIGMMRKEFHTAPTLLRCAIGPGISIDSFEVGDEVYQAFLDAGFDMCRIARRYPAQNGQKWHLDIKECNRMQLIAAGVKEENITVSAIDTMTDPLFFSARREGTKTGRMLTGIVLR